MERSAELSFVDTSGYANGATQVAGNGHNHKAKPRPERGQGEWQVIASDCARSAHFLLLSAPAALAQSDGLDRTVLPIPEPKPPVYTELDARNATPPPRFEVKAPEDAPNVLIVLIDDMGFGQSSAFGGPIHMPTVEASPMTACATTSSTRPRSARRPASRCSPAATTT